MEVFHVKALHTSQHSAFCRQDQDTLRGLILLSASLLRAPEHSRTSEPQLAWGKFFKRLSWPPDLGLDTYILATMQISPKILCECGPGVYLTDLSVLQLEGNCNF